MLFCQNLGQVQLAGKVLQAVQIQDMVELAVVHEVLAVGYQMVVQLAVGHQMMVQLAVGLQRMVQLALTQNL